jgi:hypothetical protein
MARDRLSYGIAHRRLMPFDGRTVQLGDWQYSLQLALWLALADTGSCTINWQYDPRWQDPVVLLLFAVGLGCTYSLRPSLLLVSEQVLRHGSTIGWEFVARGIDIFRKE